MMATLVLLGEGNREVVVIDTEGLDDEQLEAEYGLPVLAKIAIHDDVNSWPTDRGLYHRG